MENASKALLIAGGILIVILVLTVLIYGWRTYSDYFLKQQELENIDDLAKFNQQFESYERDDVMGYELISLANKVADYNERYSSVAGAKNDQKYSPITLEIKFANLSHKKKLSYDENSRLFINNTIIQSDTTNTLKGILKSAGNFESKFETKEIAAKVAKNINTLVKDNVEDYYKNVLKLSDKDIDAKIVGDFNALTGKNCNSYDEVESFIGDNANDIYKYYEYYQFKRMYFKCVDDSIEYDSVTGRISRLVFESTGKIE